MTAQTKLLLILFIVLSAAATLVQSQSMPQLMEPEVEIRDIGDTSARVAWNIEGEGEAEFYVISVVARTAQNPSSSVITETEIDTRTHLTGFELTGLIAETTYIVSVFARSQDTSDSNTVELTFATLAPQLETPTDLMIRVVGAGAKLQIDWTTVSQARSYLVSIYQGDDLSQQPVEQGPDAGGFYDSQQLMPRTTYTVTVVAQATGFRDSLPAVQSVMTGRALVGSNLENVITVTASTASITVSWQGEDERIDQYQLELNQGSTLVASFTAPVEGDGMHVFTGLMTDVAYVVKVTVLADEQLYIPFEAEREFPVRTRRQLALLLEENFTLAPGLMSVSLSWNSSAAGEATSYVISVFQEGDTDISTREVSIDAENLVWESLQAEADYILRVFAKAEGFINSEVLELSFRTELPRLASPPGLLAGPTGSSFSISWNEVMGATNYRVRVYLGEDTAAKPQIDETTSGFGYEALNLMPSTTYTVTVVAQGDPARVRDSEPASITDRTFRRFITQRPSDTVSVVPEGSDVIVVSWTGVNEHIDSYTLVLLLEMQAVTTTTASIEGGEGMREGMHRFTDLMPETNYVVRVTANTDETFNQLPNPTDNFSVSTNVGALRLRIKVFLEGPLQ